MAVFRTPQIVLFTRDVERAVDFYTAAGFEEAFRTPAEGTPVHVDLMLDGYRHRVGDADLDTRRPRLGARC